MDLLIPPPELLPYGLRAMKMVAEADGRVDASERDIVATAQRLFGSSIDMAALPPIEPSELADRITDPRMQRQLLRGMVVLSLADGEASPAELDVVERFAAAFSTDDRELETLRDLANQRLMLVRFDVLRRFWARRKIVEYAKDKGLGWVARTLAALTGLAEDSATADRYRALADCPEGSLGRGYFDFIRDNDFSFPGEKGSPPEVIALHDLTHVLGGYGTDPSGEMQVLAFHAGCRAEKDDPFSFLVFGIVQFHLGIQTSPVAEGHRGHLEPAVVLRALQRGVACRIDPTEGWDPWPVMHHDLDALRQDLSIPPP